MNNRTTAVSLAALLTLAGLARAAEPASRPAVDLPAAERLLDRVRSLDLSAAQKQQFEQLRAEVAETVRGMAAELKDLPPAERREKLRQALDVREKVKAILTPEQIAQLKTTPTAAATPAASRSRTSRPTPRRPSKTARPPGPRATAR